MAQVFPQFKPGRGEGRVPRGAVPGVPRLPCSVRRESPSPLLRAEEWRDVAPISTKERDMTPDRPGRRASRSSRRRLLPPRRPNVAVRRNGEAVPAGGEEGNARSPPVAPAAARYAARTRWGRSGGGEVTCQWLEYAGRHRPTPCRGMRPVQ